MKILITAFEPFDNNDINFSYEVLQKLRVHNDLIKATIPVEYLGSFKTIKKLIEVHQPDIIVCLGEARSYPSVAFEVIGINEYSNYPDNVNFSPPSRFIVPNGPDGIFSTLDYDLFAASFTATETKFHRSFSAGTYVCNTLLYTTLHYLQTEKLAIPCGFIHIPNLANQEIESIVKGLDKYIESLLK